MITENGWMFPVINCKTKLTVAYFLLKLDAEKFVNDRVTFANEYVILEPGWLDSFIEGK